MIKLSVIIIVKNDHKLKITLNSLEKQDIPLTKEVIVVDASEGEIDNIKDQFPSIKWIRFKPIKGRSTTIPHQRNIGIQNAVGNIIIFIDSSCHAEPNWLRNLLTPILQENEQITCGAAGSLNGTSFRNQTLSKNIKKRYLNECPTINIAIKKEVFDKVGRFDEKFEYGSDVDFSWRAIDLGFKIRYVPEAYIFHEWGSAKDENKRSFLYGQARIRLYKKHKNRISYILVNDPIAVVYPLFILLCPLTIVFHYYPLLLIIPFVRNIRHKPFHTLLDHIIYGFGVITGIFL